MLGYPGSYDANSLCDNRFGSNMGSTVPECALPRSVPVTVREPERCRIEPATTLDRRYLARPV
ncbi:hypothetical protein GCM10007304_33040 [Rhodococcoides trifolii]|uniref:Uncharacterized protein n=1 Tax=Rhodococcoides trifolii TaxID=908250 RepID=A0A917G0E4_9NOCA|nr:hypothetical protein GCM10007304_33040 [Rhodococcus trifolii]